MSLTVDDVSFHYPRQPHPAVRSLSLRLEPGEFVLLLGANGSGKSTLAHLMSGLYLPDTGEVRIDGTATSDAARRPSLRGRVGLLFQHPDNQVVAHTVADEVAFGLENLNLPAEKIKARVFATLNTVGLLAEAAAPPETLSGGQLQRLALAGVLAMRPRYLLADEPFAWLDAPAQASLLAELDALCRAGCAVVVVSQETDLLARADRVWLMGQGRLTEASPRQLAERPTLFDHAGLPVPPLLQLATCLQPHLPANPTTPSQAAFGVDQALAWLVPQLPPAPASGSSAPRPTAAESCLDLEGVGFDHDPRNPQDGWLFASMDLSVKEGAWWALSGPSGCGKSSLVQLFNGLLKPLAGRIRIKGASIAGRRTAQLCRQVGLVFQNPRQQFFAESVYAELAYALKERPEPVTDLDARIHQMCQKLDLDPSLLARPPRALSGGEQLKVALGSVLLLAPSLLILDETLTSLDPNGRQRALDVLRRLNGEGLTVITVTHRPAQVPQADHLACLSDGRLAVYPFEQVPYPYLPELAQLSERLLGRRCYEVEAVCAGIVEGLQQKV